VRAGAAVAGAPDVTGGATLQELCIAGGTIDVHIRPPGSSRVTLFIKKLTGKIITLDDVWFGGSGRETTIADVKDLIAVKEDYFNYCPPEQQRIIFEGKQLANDRTLAHYDISNETTLMLVLKLGGPRPRMFCETPGRVDSALMGALHDAVPLLRVEVDAPDGNTYTIVVDTLAPVGALAPLLARAMARRAAPDGGGDAEVEALRAELECAQIKYDAALLVAKQRGAPASTAVRSA
jgi:hypothetical protein